MTYKVQIDDVVRDATPAEAAAIEAAQAEAAAQAAELAAQIAARESALAKLAALGLTDDEIAALVGR
jgi:DNA-binding NarL/FixJ family response regulator